MSAQGEHVFNAVGDLAKEFVTTLDLAINPAASPEKRTAAKDAIRELQQSAAELIDKRDHPEFAVAEPGEGAKRNEDDYSNFCQLTRREVPHLYTSAGGALQAQAQRTLTTLLNEIQLYTIDRKAYASARARLPARRQGTFDEWFENTKELMKKTYRLLIEAALAVNRTRLIGS
jgi:hypothetical protein